MRLLKYLGWHKGAVLLVLVLLMGQAYCDLMLPRYTASIVDVGIQQYGIEHASPDHMSAQTYDAIRLMLPDDDAELFASSYEDQHDGTYALAESAQQDRDRLDQLVAFPLVLANALQQATAGDAGSALPIGAASIADTSALADIAQTLALEQRQYLTELATRGDISLEAIVSAVDQGVFEKEQVVALVSALRAAIPVTDDLVMQQALSAVKAEYDRIGVDTAAMQLEYLLLTAARMMGFVALSVLIASLVGLVASRTGAKIGRRLRSSLFAKVMSFSDAEIQRFSTASLITRGTNDIQTIQMMSIMLLRMVLYAPVLAVGGVIMIAQTDFSMGWVIAAAIVLLVLVIIVLMVIAMPKFLIMQKLVDRVNLVSREMLTGVSVVRAFGQQDREQHRFDEASTDLMRTQLFTNRVMTFLIPTMILIMNGISVVIVWTGSHAIDEGTIQTGDLIAFITYSMVIIMGFLMLGMIAVIAPRADVSAQRIDEVLETGLAISDPAPDIAAAAQKQLEEAAQRAPGATIAFDHVDFRYDDDSECVLRDVTFTAEAGKTCAIIGSTGSGKSTIVKLIERFYDVSAGTVTIDGVDVRDIPQHVLRAQLGYVPQKAFLFTGTVRSNVGYGVDSVDNDERGIESAAAKVGVAAEAVNSSAASVDAKTSQRIADAVEIAQAAEFVDAKQDGYDAEITQGGTNVSGGQRQRLAIARALATNARAFLFDDSFSALDYKTDAQLRKALVTRMAGKTQIVVAQRIATVLHADKIVVLDDGQIVGEGTHDQLMATCAPYREIAYSQLSPEELGKRDDETDLPSSSAEGEGGELS